MEPNEIVRFVEELRRYGFRRDRAAADCIEHLQAELEASKRRERAAIAILNSIEWVGSGAKGRIEDAIGTLRGPEQEGEPTRGTCTTTGHPCCGCAPVCGSERREESR